MWQTRANQVEHRQVGDRAPVGQAAPLDVGRLLGAHALAELVEQAGLPDPGVADDADELSPTAEGGAQPAVQHRHLLMAADEARHAPGRAQPRPFAPDEAERGRSLVRSRRGGVSSNRRSSSAPAAGLARMLPGSAAAIRSSSTEAPAPSPPGRSGSWRPRLGHQDLSRVDGDPRRERGGGVSADPLDGPLHRHRGVRRAPRRVLDGLHAEGGVQGRAARAPRRVRRSSGPSRSASRARARRPRGRRAGLRHHERHAHQRDGPPLPADRGRARCATAAPDGGSVRRRRRGRAGARSARARRASPPTAVPSRSPSFSMRARTVLREMLRMAAVREMFQPV